MHLHRNSAPNMDTKHEYPYGFPFKPYPCQVDLMSSGYKVFSDNGFGVFESPTGTGKSLAMLCAALTWLDDNEEKLLLEQLNKTNLTQCSPSPAALPQKDPMSYFEHNTAEYKTFVETEPCRKYLINNSTRTYIGDVKGKHVLDVGCGEGIFSRWLAADGAASCVGFDISDNMIESALMQKEAGGEANEKTNFFVANLMNIEDDKDGEFQKNSKLMKSGSFDLAIVSFVLLFAKNAEHILKMMRGIKKYLKQDGKIHIVNINYDNLWDCHLNGTLNMYEKYSTCFKLEEVDDSDSSCSSSGITTTTNTTTTMKKWVLHISVKNQYGASGPFGCQGTFVSNKRICDVLSEAGFKDIVTNTNCTVTDEGIKLHGKDFYQDYIQKPMHICYTAFNQ